jgi:proteic killer suppression protein
MIRSFADRETERFFWTGVPRKLPVEVQRRAGSRLIQLNAATQVGDLRHPQSNRLEALRRDRKDHWSIRINQQWRICFRFEAGHAYDVEIVDYH